MGPDRGMASRFRPNVSVIGANRAAMVTDASSQSHICHGERHEFPCSA